MTMRCDRRHGGCLIRGREIKDFHTLSDVQILQNNDGSLVKLDRIPEVLD